MVFLKDNQIPYPHPEVHQVEEAPYAYRYWFIYE